MQAQRVVVLVDMDGVLANFEEGCLREFKQKYPDSPSIPLSERETHDIKQQYDQLGEEGSGLGTKMREIIHSQGFYAMLKPIHGALEAMREMRALGWEVFICTAPARNSHCLSEKGGWVEGHLGQEWRERLITTRDKTLVYGNFLIDDKPEVTGLMKPSFRHILYDQPYNRKVEKERPRLDWSNWKEVLIPLVGSL